MPIIDEYTFELPVNITFRDCDATEHLRLSALQGYLVDAAGIQYEKRGFSHHKLLAMDQVFLLARIRIDVTSLPTNGDTINIRTWESSVQGMQFNRCHEVLKDNQPIITANSTWVLFAPSTRKILRPSAWQATKITGNGLTVKCAECNRLIIDPSTLTAGAKHIVSYSELDANCHLYSANYINIIIDALPNELKAQMIKSLAIDYIREARLNDHIHILLGQPNSNPKLVQLIGEDGNHLAYFTAQVTFF